MNKRENNFAEFLKNGNVIGLSPDDGDDGGFFVPKRIRVNNRGRIGQFLVRMGILKPSYTYIDPIYDEIMQKARDAFRIPTDNCRLMD